MLMSRSSSNTAAAAVQLACSSTQHHSTRRSSVSVACIMLVLASGFPMAWWLCRCRRRLRFCFCLKTSSCSDFLILDLFFPCSPKISLPQRGNVVQFFSSSYLPSITCSLLLVGSPQRLCFGLSSFSTHSGSVYIVGRLMPLFRLPPSTTLPRQTPQLLSSLKNILRASIGIFSLRQLTCPCP